MYGRRRASGGQRSLAEEARLKVEKPVEVRLTLQRRAPGNLRRHVVRAVWGVLVLVLGDLATFWLLRQALRAVREGALLGSGFADRVTAVLPTGHLNGWQFAVALLVSLVVTGNYGPGDRRRDPRRLFLACALATALPLWTVLWARGLPAALAHYSLTVICVWLGLVAERFTIDRLAGWVGAPAEEAVQALFVGEAGECRRVMGSPAFQSGAHYRAVGFVQVGHPPAEGALGHIAEFSAVLAASGAEAVIACGNLSDTDFHEVVDASLAAGCQVLSVPRAVEIAGVEPSVVWRQGQPLVRLTAPSLRGQQLVIKRLMDVVGGLCGLVLAAPVFAVVALLVKRGSPGPVFFRQVRVGRGGRPFNIIKFRTMVDGADAQRDGLRDLSLYPDARLFKMLADPRVTRVGRWLRRTSLDELPQLINVVTGDMSLVGPRPPLPAEVALYEKHHYARFDVKPGLTGPWQVSGRNEMRDFEEIVLLETNYVRTWSLLSDLAILLRTIPAVFGMRGAH